MKKLLSIVTALALTVGAAGMTVSAHGGHHRGGRHSGTQTKTVYYCKNDCSYVDEDGDGVCDNCDSIGWYCSKNCAYADEDGNGICDNCGTHRYYCKDGCAYIDEDGDGICDNCDSKGWYCKNDCSYVDKDGDGICDNCDAKGVCSYKPKTRQGRCHH